MKKFCQVLFALLFLVLSVNSGYCSFFDQTKIEDLDTEVVAAAQKGDPVYQFIVGRELIGGYVYDTRNAKEAFFWLDKAHAQGNAFATNELALIFQYKGGDEFQNYSKAFEYLCLSVELGNVESVSRLAEMYYKGQGTLRNFEEAYAWLATALAIYDDPEFGKASNERLDEIRSKMTSQEIKSAKKLAKKHYKHFQKADREFKSTEMYKKTVGYFMEKE